MQSGFPVGAGIKRASPSVTMRKLAKGMKKKRASFHEFTPQQASDYAYSELPRRELYLKKIEDAAYRRIHPSPAHSALNEYINEKANGWPYTEREVIILGWVVDYLVREDKLIIEVSMNNTARVSWYESNPKRESSIRKAGYKIFRVNEEDLLNNVKDTLQAVELYMNSKHLLHRDKPSNEQRDELLEKRDRNRIECKHREDGKLHDLACKQCQTKFQARFMCDFCSHTCAIEYFTSSWLTRKKDNPVAKKASNTAKTSKITREQKEQWEREMLAKKKAPGTTLAHC